MTTTQLPPPVTSAGRAASVSATPPRRFLAALEDRRLVLANVGPNWFTSVMGTSIVATAAAVLWVLGTVYGLATAVAVPYWAFTRHDVPEDGAFGGWLMPVVPPMVSAATGALLIRTPLPGSYG
jgi:tellurite resistance protein TehA-like permease